MHEMPFTHTLTMRILVLMFLYAAPVRAAGVVEPEWARFSVLVAAGPVEPPADAYRRLKPLVYGNHRVRLEDRHVYAIAKNYGTTAASLQSANNEDLILLPPGRSIKVFNKTGMLYDVGPGPGGKGEDLDSILAKFSRHPQTALRLKEKVVLSNGLPGTALLRSYTVDKGRALWIPDAYRDMDTFRFPFEAQEAGANRISSVFGERFHPILSVHKMHKGVDFAKPYGTPVYPARGGRVVEAGWVNGFGNTVVIQHADRMETIYGHLSKILVKKGQYVSRERTLLGKVGSTGLATGPHLHFEVRDRDGNPIDPRKKIGRK